MSTDDLRTLPPVLDVPTAGRLLGLGRTAAYDLVLAGKWPTPVLRLGRRLRIPTAPLLALLGLPQIAAGRSAVSQCGESLEASPTAPAVSDEGDQP
jgi:predicted DNA-binding transcriptional regulator AlpA